jgi:hypothetical protein
LDEISNVRETWGMRNHTSEAPAAGRRPVFLVGPEAGFWITSASFLIVMAYSTVPTPLWGLYQQRDGFSTFAITIAFAAYALGVVATLFLVGHLGDSLGRRRLLLPAVGLQIASALIFIAWPELPGLVAARVVSGLGVGMLTATITAHILDLHLSSRPGRGAFRGQIVAGMANIGGFGVGALVSGVLSESFRSPLVTPYVIFLCLLVAAFIGLAVVPETATVPEVRPVYRPQRISLPKSARFQYLLAAGLAFAGFSILGLFTSLAPGFLAGELGISSRATAGVVVFVTFTVAAASQFVVEPLSLRAQLTLGSFCLVAGLVLLTIVVATLGGLMLFVVGGILCGAGAGPLFKSAMGIAVSLSDATNRGELLAGMFLIGYVGLTVPVVGIGVATRTVSLSTALDGFAVLIVTITLVSTSTLLLGLHRGRARARVIVST